MCFKSVDNVTEEAVCVNNGVSDIAIAVDGIWHNRGPPPLNVEQLV